MIIYDKGIALKVNDQFSVLLLTCTQEYSPLYAPYIWTIYEHVSSASFTISPHLCFYTVWSMSQEIFHLDRRSHFNLVKNSTKSWNSTLLKSLPLSPPLRYLYCAPLPRGRPLFIDGARVSPFMNFRFDFLPCFSSYLSFAFFLSLSFPSVEFRPFRELHEHWGSMVCPATKKKKAIESAIVS